MAPPEYTSSKQAYYSFIDPGRMTGLADQWRTVYPHSGHLSAAGRVQDRVSSPAKDRRSANCATQPTKLLACTTFAGILL